MFRWVDCQLMEIRKCKSPDALRKTLRSLPKDLYEQYSRELAKIPEASAAYAVRLLQWIAFPQCKYVYSSKMLPDIKVLTTNYLKITTGSCG